MSDPDLEIRDGGGGGGGGERRTGLQNIFAVHWASFWSKNKGGKPPPPGSTTGKYAKMLSNGFPLSG